MSVCSFQTWPLIWEQKKEYRSLPWSWAAPSETIMGMSLWRNPMLRLISELVPHYVQCTLIFCMALERYILICHAASASQILNKRRRCLCYVFIVAFLIFVTGSVFHVMRHGFSENYYDDSISTISDYPEMAFLKVDSIRTEQFF